MEKKAKNAKENSAPPVWEWILAAFGLVLVCVAIGSMIHRGVTQESSPPNLSIQVESTTPVQNGYAVAFRVKNTGTQTAAAVNIEAILMQGEEEMENGTATITYMPAGSEREGGVFFTKDPRALELRIRVLGYEKP